MADFCTPGGVILYPNGLVAQTEDPPSYMLDACSFGAPSPNMTIESRLEAIARRHPGFIEVGVVKDGRVVFGGITVNSDAIAEIAVLGEIDISDGCVWCGEQICVMAGRCDKCKRPRCVHLRSAGFDVTSALTGHTWTVMCGTLRPGWMLGGSIATKLRRRGIKWGPTWGHHRGIKTTPGQAAFNGTNGHASRTLTKGHKQNA